MPRIATVTPSTATIRPIESIGRAANQAMATKTPVARPRKRASAAEELRSPEQQDRDASLRGLLLAGRAAKQAMAMDARGAPPKASERS